MTVLDPRFHGVQAPAGIYFVILSEAKDLNELTRDPSFHGDDEKEIPRFARDDEGFAREDVSRHCERSLEIVTFLSCH
ncbi:MAG: hypothetical protein A3F16_00340 [Deltaproteobacteria bacterium RIFCSPHIGHO2_12_FULL_43_9]|nr:MAG: hypothetical protein A3F16_00340 [Deltaproteobacteria bacterium RIFCSPHIGHO2_12_FULL_43_9]